MRRTRLLLAVPNPVWCNLCCEMLRRYHYHVDSATDGLACLEKLNERPPDFLIIDVGLLWGGAEGVLTVMQEWPHLREIPVIVAGSGGPSESLRTLMQTCCATWIAQPFDLETLFESFQVVQQSRGDQVKHTVHHEGFSPNVEF